MVVGDKTCLIIKRWTCYFSNFGKLSITYQRCQIFYSNLGLISCSKIKSTYDLGGNWQKQQRLEKYQPPAKQFCYPQYQNSAWQQGRKIDCPDGAWSFKIWYRLYIILLTNSAEPELILEGYPYPGSTITN